MADDYHSIVRHYEKCLARHGDSHRGVDWPDAEAANVRYQVMLDVIRDTDPPCTLLDFGCGLSHLYGYMQVAGPPGVQYAGLDLSPQFVEQSRRKYPDVAYHQIDVLDEPDALPVFDYIVMNGVFTEKCDLSHDAMFDYFKKLLVAVFAKATRGVAFNVMSKQVDWERDDLFHLPLDDLAWFLHRELSRRFVIRNDYGLYEYTTYLYH